MRISKRQLRRVIREEKTKLLNEASAEEQTFQQVGGDQPVFHDAAMDQALNDYVMQYVWRLEEDIGESRGTLALLETMKEYLVEALEKAAREAMADSGVRY
jgi:hypothetical protein